MYLTRWRSASTQSTDSLEFRHGPLKSNKTGMRLAQIQPGTGNKGIAIDLIDSFVSGPGHVPYDALSYAWGNNERTKMISCNGRRLAITQNLLEALHRFREPDRVVTIWIDQICVCQERIKERNQQVQLMGKIFKRARKVIVWLGEDDEDSRAGMQLITQLLSISHHQSVSGLTPADLDIHGLPKREHRRWTALFAILRRRWFWRTWVVQEVVLNPNVQFVLGSPLNPSVSWDELERVVALLEGPIPREWQLDQSLNASELPFSRMNRIRMRHQRLITTPVTPTAPEIKYDIDTDMNMDSESGLIDDQDDDPQLLDLLLMSRSLGATDPRDKIFALLGLSQHNIDPDYSLSPETVFTQFARQTIAAVEDVKNGSSDISVRHREVRRAMILISCAGRHHQKLELPSWTPDWSVNLNSRPLVFGLGRKFNAGGDRLGPFQVKDDSSLHLCGKLLDTIRDVGKVKLNFDAGFGDSRPHRLIEQWWDEAQQIATRRIVQSPGSTMNVPAFEALRRDLSLCRHGYYVGAAGTSQNTSMFDDAGIPSEPKHSASCASRTLTLGPTRGRVVFASATGYIGLAPHGTMEGDLIFVVIGADVPFVLRPCEQGYELIGEAYVQGAMSGQVMERDDIVVQDIFLR
ncbi:heterokaryon incompatibility protein-domain-containing protein [Neohortaea acidophila]|uniref:Heterokaryon incompatibility protein-domain-containing protein n=1 Tax=Neohortaea acidophila TaxID=245834 RepID=A0A6A6PZQ0_9PEZI|nr:heterokaryon incompatibility protein-domain-containing protein [Neohortaea acidophila]KAF2485505.1 heterokaryon incompatibility protein-domain-containing protein [Neohortaea acidophila]